MELALLLEPSVHSVFARPKKFSDEQARNPCSEEDDPSAREVLEPKLIEPPLVELPVYESRIDEARVEHGDDAPGQEGHALCCSSRDDADPYGGACDSEN